MRKQSFSSLQIFLRLREKNRAEHLVTKKIPAKQKEWKKDRACEKCPIPYPYPHLITFLMVRP